MSDLLGMPGVPGDDEAGADARFTQIAAAAGRTSTPPAFVGIRARGRRRVRVMRVGGSALVVAALAVVGLGIHAVSDAARSDRVVNHGLPTTASGVVHSPRAVLVALAADSTFPRMRSAEWRVCADPSCGVSVTAVAVTSDSFIHQHDYLTSPGSPLVSPFIVPGGSETGGRFLVVIGGRPALVDSSGHAEQVQVSAHATPMRSLDTLVAMPQPDGTVRPFGLSLAAAEMYPVTTPDNAHFASIVDVGEIGHALFAVDADGTTTWQSRDHGATWSRTQLHASSPAILPGTDQISEAVASTDARGGPRMATVQQSLDQGISWRHVVSARFAGCRAAWATTLNGGELLVAIDHGTPATPPGLYVSRQADWTLFTRIPGTLNEGASGGRPTTWNTTLLLSTLQPILHDGQHARQMVYTASHGDVLLASSDGGRTWSRLLAR